MTRSKIMVEDPVEEKIMTEEELDKLWMDKLMEMQKINKTARAFVKQHDLASRDTLFLVALNTILSELIDKKS
jgi:hypothetical protein